MEIEQRERKATVLGTAEKKLLQKLLAREDITVPVDNEGIDYLGHLGSKELANKKTDDAKDLRRKDFEKAVEELRPHFEEGTPLSHVRAALVRVFNEYKAKRSIARRRIIGTKSASCWIAKSNK